MLDEGTKAQLKERLLEEKQRLEEQIARDNQEVLDMSGEQYNENTYGNHMADDGGYLQEIDRTTAIREQLQDSLDHVNQALQRMEEGTYGLSQISGKPIPVERLEALPWATTLVDE